MKTVHWTWSSRQKTSAKGEVTLGKKALGYSGDPRELAKHKR
jgi:hypothetical protein